MQIAFQVSDGHVASGHRVGRCGSRALVLHPGGTGEPSVRGTQSSLAARPHPGLMGAESEGGAQEPGFCCSVSFELIATCSHV